MTTTLREKLPTSFLVEYEGTRAAALLDQEVVQEHPGNTWGGREKYVCAWWELADGHAVAWNENPTLGWSFPVRKLRPAERSLAEPEPEIAEPAPRPEPKGRSARQPGTSLSEQLDHTLRFTQGTMPITMVVATQAEAEELERLKHGRRNAALVDFRVEAAAWEGARLD